MSDNEASDEIEREIHPLYFYELTSKLKQQAKDELFESADATKSALSEFRDLLKNGELAKFTASDEELLPFLRARKYNVQRAYALYRNHATQFKRYDDLFKDVDFSRVVKVMRNNAVGLLPNRDTDGCIVGIGYLRKWNTSEVSATDLIRANILCLMDVMLQCPISQIAGSKCVVDSSAMTLRHLLCVRPWHLKYAAEVFQNCMPLRFKEFHIVNHGPLAYSFWKLLRPLLSEKIVQRVYFHGKDMKSLHQFVSPAILPKDLGGNMDPFDNNDWLDNFIQSKESIMGRIKKFRTKDSA